MGARSALLVAAIAAALGWSAPAAAHCDTLDGPVVAAARDALATGEVQRALIWVRKADERAIREAFAKARASRAPGGAAAERADHAFYRTLVRVHRAGEGAPFTGLKPSGTVEPPVVAADRALASGRLADVEVPIVERTRSALQRRFEDVVARREFDPADVTAGRDFVGAYVRYVHQVEAMYVAADTAGEHAHEAPRPDVRARPEAAAPATTPGQPAHHH